jgi:hypothetical protein
MTKKEIQKKIKDLLNNKDYQFRFLMAGVYLGKSEIKCGICEEMVDHRLILKAMGQYRNEGLRGELIKFKTWVDGNTAIFSMVNIGDDVVDEYLKQKP